MTGPPGVYGPGRVRAYQAMASPVQRDRLVSSPFGRGIGGEFPPEPTGEARGYPRVAMVRESDGGIEHSAEGDVPAVGWQAAQRDDHGGTQPATQPRRDQAAIRHTRGSE